MLWMKACPRCRGDVYLERDIEGDWARCLQCSATLTGAQQRALGAPQRLPRRPTPKANLIRRAAAG